MGKRAPQPDDGLTFDMTKLRTRRRVMDLTQRRLAAAVGADANAVLEWERHGREPGLFQFIRAARVLGTPLFDLIDVRDAEGRDGKPRRAHERN
jgi:transcriptional regulator with XRE-family HTH domain